MQKKVELCQVIYAHSIPHGEADKNVHNPVDNVDKY